MARGLTKKQKGFVAEYVKTGNATKSALKVYDTTDYRTANNIGSENLAKPSIQQAVKSIADRIPDELLERVHLEGLEASDIQYDSEGEIIKEKPDYATRHRYLDSAYKLKGSYAPIKTKGEVTINKINELTTDELNAILEGGSIEGTS